MDRPDLDLDYRCNSLIKAAAIDSKKTIVLASIPGAILTPWRHEVDAAAIIFLGGQELGTAYASVIFGDHAPTGHLPLTLPETRADTIEPEPDNVWYTEGMKTGYRNKDIKVAFPFGHGLTYTTFEYTEIMQDACESEECVTSVRATIKNTGAKQSSATPQLYLEFPAEANFPSFVLKGFEKTQSLKPGESTVVTFALSWRDLSYWEDDKWIMPASLKAHVGASSADIRGSAEVSVSQMLVL